MRSSMRLSVRARWLTSSLRLVVGTLALRSEWPILRGGFGNLANVAQHAPSGEEDNAEPEQNNQQPQKKEAQAQASEHPQFIPLGEAEIDLAAIVDADGGDAKRNCESRDTDVGRAVRGNLGGLDGFQMVFAVAGANPQLERAVAARLQKEDRVV